MRLVLKISSLLHYCDGYLMTLPIFFFILTFSLLMGSLLRLALSPSFPMLFALVFSEIRYLINRVRLVLSRTIFSKICGDVEWLLSTLKRELISPLDRVFSCFFFCPLAIGESV